jgi:PP-loop superfamily ATP-utilizing enzyme
MPNDIEEEHVIMFDTNIIEEFGIKKPRVEEFAKQFNLKYKFKHAAVCNVHASRIS